MTANETKTETESRETAPVASIESLLEEFDALGDAAARRITKTSGKLAERVASLRHVEVRIVPAGTER